MIYLAWIAAAEVKVGVIVAICTAMLGALGAAYAAEKAMRSMPANVATFAAIFLLCGALFCAAMAVLPRLTGPKSSLLFFGLIGPCADVDYMDRFKKATDEQLLDDWLAQIHRNAQIACEKFRWVRKAMWWAFLSVVPWVLSIYFLLQK